MYCEFCGSSLDEGVLACPVCGNARSDTLPSRRAAPAPPRAPEVEVMPGPQCPQHPGMPLVGKCPRCGREVCVRCAPEAAFDDFTCTDCKGLTQAHALAPAGAQCALHPQAAAAFICSRCGSFACNACRAFGAGSEGLCARCATASGPLASRSSRFLANLIDNLAVALPAILVVVGGAILGSVAKLKRVDELMIPLGVMGALLGAGAELAAQMSWGQSIGKRLLAIKVVRLNGDPIELWRVIVLRNLVVHFAAQLCGIVGLVDALLIFGAEQRCLHDYLADSKVIEVPRG